MLGHNTIKRKLISKGFSKSKKSRNIPWRISKKEWGKFIEDCNKICFYCGNYFCGINDLTIDRIDCFFGYYINNIALSCLSCNKTKSTYEASMYRNKSFYFCIIPQISEEERYLNNLVPL